MFAPGTKIVLKNSSYIVTDDSLSEPERVEVWIENKGFTKVLRTEIISDIIDSAYVTSVRHNVTSTRELDNVVYYCTKDAMKRWAFMIPANVDTVTGRRIRSAIIDDVLERVGRKLLVDIGYEDITVEINGGTYYLQRLISEKMATVYEELS